MMGQYLQALSICWMKNNYPNVHDDDTFINIDSFVISTILTFWSSIY